MSLRWGLENQDKINWVINNKGSLDDVCRKIISIAHNEVGERKQAVPIAEQMLKVAESKSTIL
jgi:hypothetical protein